MERTFNANFSLLTLLVCVWVAFGFSMVHASPKGTIAFLSNRNNADKLPQCPAIYLINADGTNERLWLENAEGFSGMAWSPDGRWIAFQSLRDSTIQNPNWNIYIMAANGENEMRLTNHAGMDSSPTWVIPDRSLPVNTRANRVTFWGRLKSDR